jgi:hypothetical protein
VSHLKKHAAGLSDTDASIDSTGVCAAVDSILTLKPGRGAKSCILSTLGREVEANEYEMELDLQKHSGWHVLAEGAEAGLEGVLNFV